MGRAAGVARQTARSGRRSDHDDEGGRGRGQTVLMVVAWSIYTGSRRDGKLKKEEKNAGERGNSTASV